MSARTPSEAFAEACVEIARLRAALDRIASWGEGEVVTGKFDEPVAAAIARAALALGGRSPMPGCHCATCDPLLPDLSNQRMITCALCGNKRCPHATDHRNDCTRSNEPGQPGSAYA
jgi:hypothetical protein